MNDKRNNFVCIGAFHPDYVLQLKNNYFKNRTNPISHKKHLGGVAYNIASKLAFLNIKTELISLNCKSVNKKWLIKNKIKFTSLTEKIYDRYYTSVLNHKGEMILGLAYMDNYEKVLPVSNIKNKINKNIIIDLNLHHRNIKSLITKYHYKNNICVCGTSSHKVYKIKDSLNKINVLILNKQESLNLTNKKSIKEALQNIIEQNKNLIIVITNGRNTVFAYHDNMIYSCKPLKVKIKNENGAGDVMSALFNYYLLKLKKFNEVLAKSVAAGGLQVSGYQSEKKTYLQKIDHMSKNIKVKVSKYNG